MTEQTMTLDELATRCTEVAERFETQLPAVLELVNEVLDAIAMASDHRTVNHGDVVLWDDDRVDAWEAETGVRRLLDAAFTLSEAAREIENPRRVDPERMAWLDRLTEKYGRETLSEMLRSDQPLPVA